MTTTALLKAHIGILAHVEVSIFLPAPHASFAKKVKTAQLSGLAPGDGLGRMSEAKDQYMADTVFLWHCLMTEALGLRRVLT